MPLYYLDLETTGLDPNRGEILTIQTKRLQGGRAVGPTVVHKAWESSEASIVRAFLEETAFFSEPWTFVPCGFNLDFEFRWLFVKAKRYGLLPPTSRLENMDKPHLDLKDLAVLMNRGEFKGAKLENFSTKMGSGDLVIRAIAAKDYASILAYIEQETEAFCRLYEALSDEMPNLWRGTLAPRLGVDPDDPRPYGRKLDPLAEAQK